jgi:glucose-6-phosphate 1-dehydrogenase
MDPQVIVMFGATGDLAHRKLWPGLVRLRQEKLLPDDVRIVASGRGEPAQRPWPDELDDITTYASASADAAGDLADAVQRARSDLGEASRTLFYMSVPPSAMAPMVKMLGAHDLADERCRIVMEKPFGHDLESAKALNATLHEQFDEDQIFRIDHFLGKEAAQDILALRFANGLFEPIWNREHVAAVQIDIPEALGLEGRASFYEETGAFRDMVVTHLCQVLGFVAMEPPDSLDAQHLRDAKAAAFRALRPFDPRDTVYGQFDGYRQEEGVDPESTVETFVALKAYVDDDRWRDVPFLLRTGKALAQDRRVVTLTFREPELDIFDGDHRPNELVFELTEDPKLAVEVRVKRPGPREAVARTALTLDVERSLNEHGLEAYERLLHDVMLGDHLLFTRADEVERLWECAAPLLKHPPAPQPYEQKSWGPEAAVRLAEPVGWRLPEGQDQRPGDLTGGAGDRAATP